MICTVSSAPAGGGLSSSGARAISSKKFGASAARPSNRRNHGSGLMPPDALRTTGSTSSLHATADTPACLNTYPASWTPNSGLLGTMIAPIRAQAKSSSAWPMSLRASTPMRSPFFTPRATSRRAVFAIAAPKSAQLQVLPANRMNGRPGSRRARLSNAPFNV